VYMPEPSSLAVVRQDTRDALVWLGVAPGSVLASDVVLVNELATNAVQHACTPFTAAVLTAPRGVRVEVRDGASAMPVTGPDTGAADCSGLLIVDRLSAAWGVDRDPTGKTVWADVYR
jgi:hypothetical protein